MRATGALRTGVAPGGALVGPWAQNELWQRARAVPSLDLRPAENKSLRDAVSGQELVTFTRASAGTSVGSDGVLRTATTNLLLRSEEFDNAYWIKLGATVTNDTTFAPNGSVTADTLKENATTGIHEIYAGGVAGITSATLSVYVKSGVGSRCLNLSASTTAANYVSVRFNPSTGQLSTVTLAGTFSNAQASTTALGGGWHRVALSFSVSFGSVAPQIALSTALEPTIGAFGLESYSGDNTSSLDIWGAQLEQSSTVGEYIPTTSTINSAPRFDHNPTTGESLGLLVEEQRTNLVLQSEDFSTTWSRPQSDTITTNSVNSPAGSASADSFVENSTASSLHTILQDATIVANATYTFTLFVKTALRSELLIKLSDVPDTNGVNSTFNLSSLATTVGNYGTGSGGTVSIQPMAGGWYRCVVSGALGGSITTLRIRIRSLASGLETYNGSGQTALYLWGAQLEAGSFPTSYIPTTTAAATRSADVASITGTAFSSWYRQDEGTLYAEGAVPAGTSSARALAGIDDGTNNERILFGHNGTTAIQNLIVDGNITQVNTTVTAASFPVNTYRKLAFAFKENNFAGIIAPGTVENDTSGTMPTPTQLQIGNAPGRSQPCLPIKRVTYWPQRLSDPVLLSITQ